MPLSLSVLRANLRNRRERLADLTHRLPQGARRAHARQRERLTQMAQRLTRARMRTLTDAARHIARDRDRIAGLTHRLLATASRMLPPRRDQLDRIDRLRQTLGYRETLRRGYAVVHGPEGLLTTAEKAAQIPRFDLEFLDGRLTVRPDTAPAKPARKSPGPKDQKSLF